MDKGEERELGRKKEDVKGEMKVKKMEVKKKYILKRGKEDKKKKRKNKEANEETDANGKN